MRDILKSDEGILANLKFYDVRLLTKSVFVTAV